MPVPSKLSPPSSDLPVNLPGSDLNYTILHTLEKLFHPTQTPDLQVLRTVIRVLARQIRRFQTHTGDANSNEDLGVLLAVSIALERAERRERAERSGGTSAAIAAPPPPAESLGQIPEPPL